MYRNRNILKILLIIIVTITSLEIVYYFVIRQTKIESTSISSHLIPTPTLELGDDQSYRLADAPDRLTRFLTAATHSFISELTDYNPTKSVKLQMNSLYEGKVESFYQGDQARKIWPPDPEHPKRDVELIIYITDPIGTPDTSETIRILITESEMSNVKVTDEHKKKLTLNDIKKGKQVRINRRIELPVTKTTDIVTLEPLVYTDIIVLDQ